MVEGQLMSLLAEVENLTKYFPVGSGVFSRERKVVHAVDGISFEIKRLENFGLVGESGCGKSTVARLVTGLMTPTAGLVRSMGRDLSTIPNVEMRKLRHDMQMIFQDATASLNPRKTVRQILGLPYVLSEDFGREQIESKVLALLEVVGLIPAEQYVDRYPHEFSGGQRQRIVIARAVAMNPKLVVADEPVAALDVSIRGQILNLLKDLERKFEVTFLYISHDLSLVRSMVDRVATMYLGKIVEVADVEVFYNQPMHPYTKALLSATPIANPKVSRATERIVLKGEVPSPIDPPSGCRFRTRCPSVFPRCAQEAPELLEVTKGHHVACHLYSD
jgi:oligopeptide/dipeptide ABC transporter ATP-binding protein